MSRVPYHAAWLARAKLTPHPLGGGRYVGALGAAKLIVIPGLDEKGAEIVDIYVDHSWNREPPSVPQVPPVACDPVEARPPSRRRPLVRAG